MAQADELRPARLAAGRWTGGASRGAPPVAFQGSGIEGGALYDPEVNYNRVKGQIFDWADDPAPQQQATDTRAIPAATASVPVGPPAPPRQ